MRHKGTVIMVSNERSRDLLAAFNGIVGRMNGALPSEIFTILVEMPAPRFYVSEERAAVVIGQRLSGIRQKLLTKTKKEMFDEICRRAIQIKKENPELNINEIASIVVHQPAPKFYTTPKSARMIVTQWRKKVFEQKKRELRHSF